MNTKNKGKLSYLDESRCKVPNPDERRQILEVKKIESLMDGNVDKNPLMLALLEDVRKDLGLAKKVMSESQWEAIEKHEMEFMNNILNHHSFDPTADGMISLRTKACIIDSIIVICFTLLFNQIIIFLTGVHNLTKMDIIIYLGYFAILESKWGATIGKRMVGIKVCSEDGTPPSTSQILGRNLLRIIDGFLFYWLPFSPFSVSAKNQRIGDIVAELL